MSTGLHINESVFCKMVRFYGKTFNLPPLAAKIYSYLIFDFERKGMTFDELVEVFSASKSSVSTNLNLLISNKLVSDINKLDERKRYFVINQNFIKIRFEEIVEKLTEELSIIESIEAIRKQHSETDILKSKIYKSLLEKNITTINESLIQLSKI